MSFAQTNEVRREFIMSKASDLLENVGITKPIIFKKVLGILTDEWMAMDDINKQAKLPISQQGLEAHIQELVKKGKVKESMWKGKNQYKKAKGLKI